MCAQPDTPRQLSSISPRTPASFPLRDVEINHGSGAERASDDSSRTLLYFPGGSHQVAAQSRPAQEYLTEVRHALFFQPISTLKSLPPVLVWKVRRTFDYTAIFPNRETRRLSFPILPVPSQRTIPSALP
jgi:hypothetical protein